MYYQIIDNVTKNDLLNIIMSKLQQVFFKLNFGGSKTGRIVFELFSDITPKTC